MENWKPVVGYEGFYEVSDSGNVRSVRKQLTGCRSFAAQSIKQGTTRAGYRYVTLWLYGIKRCWNVHRLVAMAFIGPIQDGPRIVVDHINRNPLDNRLSNLRYATQGQNNANSTKKRCANGLAKGVDYCKRERKWRARIQYDGKETGLGYFNSPEEATKARLDAEPIIFGAFAPAH